MKPCTSASTMIFSYDEDEYKSKRSDWFHVILLYPNQYREIRMVQAIDLQTVIGNAGGYIGLFFRYAIFGFDQINVDSSVVRVIIEYHIQVTVF